MRSCEATERAGASRPAPPSPAPVASPTEPAPGADRLGPLRVGPGYSPWKDPTVLVLLAISLIAAVLFVGGATVGPALAGDDDGGGVFPIVDILTGDGGGGDAELSLAANRTELTAGERVAFAVTDGTDTPASNATVEIAGSRHAVDESGRVVVRIEDAGELRATASASGANTTLESNGVDLAVTPRSIRLRVEANRSVATVGEPIALTLVRADTGTQFRGSIATRLVTEGDLVPGEIGRTNGSRLVVVPERAGMLYVTGAREDGGGEIYRGYVGTVPIERREVALDLVVDPAEAVTAEPVTATVRRRDTNESVDATLSVGDRTIETGADGEASIPIETAGTATIEATATSTSAVGFVPDDVQVTIRRREVGLALDVEPTAITNGGRIDVAVTRTDTGEPVEGTVSVAGRRVATDATGTASIRIDAAGEQPVVAFAPDTPAVTFASARTTVAVADATVDLAIVDAPETVAAGESFSVTVRATNLGPDAATVALRFHVGEERVDRRTVALDPDAETELTLEAVAPETSGDVIVTVTGSDAQVNRTVSVTP